VRANPVRLSALAALVALVLAASGCVAEGGGYLLVASAPDPDPAAAAPPPVDVWAVEPGEDLDDDTLVARGATEPAGISTLLPDGRSWFNQLGRTWQGDVLLAYRTGTDSRVTAGPPGARPTTLTEAGPRSRLQTVVLRRGVATVDDEGCRLARTVGRAETIGEGRCQISEDERWVVSWPAEPGPLTIRDLRRDRTRTVEDIRVTGAAVTGYDEQVLAAEQVADGVRGRLLSATDGSTIATTDTFDGLDIVPSTLGARAMVALARQGDEFVMLWVARDGEITEVDRGPTLLPIEVDDGVTYVRLGADADDDSVRRWTPGTSPEVLLEGRVGAGSATPDTVVMTRATPDRVEVYRWRADGPHGAERVLTVPADTADGAYVSRIVVFRTTALMELVVGPRTSFLRIDLRGDDSDAPVVGWPFLRLQSVDEDGTVLLAGTPDTETTTQQLLVLRPGDDRPTMRAEADSTGVNLIHRGVVYFTDVARDGTVDVRSFRALGDDEPELLYEGVQLAGSTWPELGGATQAIVASRALYQGN
jgi:hypothetical protein